MACRYQKLIDFHMILYQGNGDPQIHCSIKFARIIESQELSLRCSRHRFLSGWYMLYTEMRVECKGSVFRVVFRIVHPPHLRFRFFSIKLYVTNSMNQ